VVPAVFCLEAVAAHAGINRAHKISSRLIFNLITIEACLAA